MQDSDSRGSFISSIHYRQSALSTNEPDLQKLTEQREKLDNIVQVIIETTNNRIFRLLERNHNTSLNKYYSQNFHVIKENAKNTETPFLDKLDLKHFISEAENPQELIEAVKKIEAEIIINTLEKFYPLKCRLQKEGDNPDIKEQYKSIFEEKSACTIELQKLLALPAKEPDVINAAKKLKSLGVKELFLGNEKILSLELIRLITAMKLRGDKIPSGIIISPFSEVKSGEMLRINHDGVVIISPLSFELKEHNIIKKSAEKASRDPLLKLIKPDEKIYVLNSVRKKLQNYMSTNNLYHNIVHEAGHLQHRDSYEFKHLKLDDSDLKTAKKLSNYAYEAKSAPEIYAELYAKLLLTGLLSKEETSLFAKLGGKV